MKTETAPLLELRRVSRVFSVGGGLLGGKQNLHALQDVSLTLHQGEVVGIVGESGCGKSTLARILLGLLPPSAGEVRMNGIPLRELRRKDMARRIQPIFQDPYSSLNPQKTVGAIIGLPLITHHMGDRKARAEKVADIMEKVGLPARLVHAYPSQLSGGQRQRVAIARALIMEPAILVCDEPTSALDVSVQSQILNLLSELRDRLGLTYLFISHNLAVVEHLATRVAVMYLGRIVEEAPTNEIFRHARHPYTQALLGSILAPEPGRPIPDTHMGDSYPNAMEPPSGCHFHPRCPRAWSVCSTIVPPLTKQDANGRVACHLYSEHESHVENVPRPLRTDFP